MANEFMDVLKQNVMGGAIGAGVVYIMLPAGATILPSVTKMLAPIGTFINQIYGMIPGGATVALIGTLAIGYIAGAYVQKMLK